MQANDLVNQTLRENKDKVDAVVTGRLKDALLETRFGYTTGYEAYRQDSDSEPYIRSTYGVRMFIRGDARSERGYTAITAFPVNDYRLKR